MERTDALAARLGISLRSLAPRMGLSVASLFGYRNGSIPISAKAWGKLEQAEAAAEGTPKTVEDGQTDYRADSQRRIDRLETALAKALESIARLTEAMERERDSKEQ